MRPSRHLRPVGTRRLQQPGCRTSGCPLAPIGGRGYCSACEAVYQAAVELRERLLERRGAQLCAARPALFLDMDQATRSRLLAHIAAQSAHRGEPATVLVLAGLEDFLDELRDLAIDGLVP